MLAGCPASCYVGMWEKNRCCKRQCVWVCGLLCSRMVVFGCSSTKKPGAQLLRCPGREEERVYGPRLHPDVRERGSGLECSSSSTLSAPWRVQNLHTVGSFSEHPARAVSICSPVFDSVIIGVWSEATRQWSYQPLCVWHPPWKGIRQPSGLVGSCGSIQVHCCWRGGWLSGWLRGRGKDCRAGFGMIAGASCLLLLSLQASTRCAGPLGHFCARMLLEQ